MSLQLVPIASDAFDRTVTDGWGDADLGGTWLLSGDAAFSVAGGRGIQGPSALSVAWLDAVSALDSDTTVRVQSDVSPLNVIVLARVQDAGTWIGAVVQLTPSAGAALLLVSSDGSLTVVVSQILSVTIDPETDVWVRLQTEGSDPTTVRVRVWLDGDTEPETWDIETTVDAPTVQPAGSVGLGSASVTGATHSFAEFSAGTWQQVDVHGSITPSQRALASLIPSQRLVSPASNGQAAATVTSSTSATTISASQSSARVEVH